MDNKFVKVHDVKRRFDDDSKYAYVLIENSVVYIKVSEIRCVNKEKYDDIDYFSIQDQCGAFYAIKADRDETLEDFMNWLYGGMQILLGRVE